MVGRRIGSYFPLMLGYSVSCKLSNQLIKYEIFGKSGPCGSVGGPAKALWGERSSFHFPVTPLQGYLALSNALDCLCLWLFFRTATIKCNTNANTVNVLKRLTSINNYSIPSKQQFQNSCVSPHIWAGTVLTMPYVSSRFNLCTSISPANLQSNTLQFPKLESVRHANEPKDIILQW